MNIFMSWLKWCQLNVNCKDMDWDSTMSPDAQVSKIDDTSTIMKPRGRVWWHLITWHGVITNEKDFESSCYSFWDVPCYLLWLRRKRGTMYLAWDKNGIWFRWVVYPINQVWCWYLARSSEPIGCSCLQIPVCGYQLWV